MMKFEEVIEFLGLAPHPEGGYYKETYRSADIFSPKSLPAIYLGERCASTCIYFLLTPGNFSAMHRIFSDEIFHFYLGDPIEMLQLMPGGTGTIVKIGNDLRCGQSPQVMVSRNVWQGARLAQGGEYALLGTTVAPGFEFADFEVGQRAALQFKYPQYAEMIHSLTRG